MSAALLLLLALSPHFVFSYNVDIASPILYQDPDSALTNYFGYSVSLSSKRSTSSVPSLFVGAPKFSNGTGRVYLCTGSSSGDRNTSSCQPLRINTKDRVVPGWLGASMASEAGKFSDLTVCAPRTLCNNCVWQQISGICYETSEALGNVFRIDNGASRLVVDYYVGHGFSVNYATRKNSDSYQGPNRIIGRPGTRSVDVEQGSHRVVRTFVDYPVNREGWTYVGYSVSSGYYFGNRGLYFAAGGPAWSAKGIVRIVELNSMLWGEIKVEGSVLGEYFGASLATGDFDGNGRDDLAVGAPHWGEVDFGRVYIYHSNPHGTFDLGQKLQGRVANGQFGHTLASADLDRDGCSDLIVSAPWEEQAGVVYVYYGRRDFGKENPSAQVIQRIEPSVFKHDGGICRFGFSLSQPTDIDGDGYPDLGVGAYKSGHAVVLRSRPVIETKIELESDPATLQTSAEHFDVSLCVTYNGKGVPESQKLSFVIKVDAMYKRAVNGPIKELDGLFSRGERTCVKTRISLIPSSGRNNVDPVMIDVTHSIKEGVDGSKVDPVLSMKSSRSSVSWTVPINTKCKILTACRARLYIDTKFGDVGANNVWVVGSGDISLIVKVRNEAEPAYDTQITIGMPPGIRLRQPIAFCKTAPDALSLACDVGNPLVKETPVSFTVDLDMSEIGVKSAGATELFFNLTKTTRSIDQGVEDSTKTLKLNIKHVAHVTLTGGTDKECADFARIAEQSKVPIQHVYQVRKSGPSPITDAYLTIDVPTSVIGRNDSFLNISDPKLIVSSGVAHNCYINDTRSVHLLRRKRHGNSGGSDETLVTSGSTATDDIPEPGSNDHTEEVNLGGYTTERTIYLNCSTEGVSCTRLTCGFGLLEMQEDVGNMVLDMTFNAMAFYTSDEDSLIVEIHTNASVDIESPMIPDSADVRNWTASARTMLYNIPEPKKLAGWILPVSIFLGILLFCIVAIILFKVGFFNRSMKLETAKARDKGSILKVNDGDDVEDVMPDLDGNGDDDHGR